MRLRYSNEHLDRTDIRYQSLSGTGVSLASSLSLSGVWNGSGLGWGVSHLLGPEALDLTWKQVLPTVLPTVPSFQGLWG